MSFAPKPCPHCHGTSFQVLPNLQLELWRVTSVLGIAASSRVTGQTGHWTYSLVICTQCSHTNIFTNNGPALGQSVPGAYLATCAG